MTETTTTDTRDKELRRGQIELRKSGIRHPGEIPWLIVGGVLCLLSYASMIGILVAASLSADQGLSNNEMIIQGIVVLMVSPLLILFARGLLYAQLRVNAVRMSPTQFPEGYRMVVEAARAAGLPRVPDAYVKSGSGVINAFASGHGFRRFVVVHSDLFEVGGAARDPDALRFVIGHEVGHLAAGHVSYWRLVTMQVLRQIPILGLFLSRAQEYTADNYGYRFCPQGSGGAIQVLSGGKYLNKNVDLHEFADRAHFEKGLFVWCANLASTHPVLTWRAHALRDRSRPGHLFTSPSFQPYGAAALPAGGEPTKRYPHPDEALAYLDTFPPQGPPQFGANFPVPLPGQEIAAPPSAYGQRTLQTGWNGQNQPQLDMNRRE
ncbi:M48 family metallopeptidase [Mariniluteicoccus flavus]